MRDQPRAPQPALGFRFAHVCDQDGTPGLYTCRAHDLLHDQPVSLRVCSGASSAGEREIFDREVEALARIGAHPGIVTLHELLDQHDTRIAVLDDARRGATDAMSARAAVRAVITLAGACETAHRLGLLHGSVEPANVYLGAGDADGGFRLAGFTERLDDPQPRVLHEASSHTAPEVLLGERLEAGVDVYGLGSTLYELIAGTPAIRSYPGESPAALSLRVLTGATVTLDRPGVPFELVDIIGWSMAVARGDRPPSAAWLAEELGRIERSQGWPRTRLRIGARSEPVTAQRRGPRHRAG
jgi:serine/threonine-protein kinase PknK